MLNYFELMSLPQSFEINLSQLQHQLRQLQTQFHPDSQFVNQHSGSDANNSAVVSPADISHSIVAQLGQLKPEQISAVVNEAYHTLKNPDSRATHLLALQGILQSKNLPIRDLDFLDEAMTFRIALDEADVNNIDHLTGQLNAWLTKAEANFRLAYQKLLASPATRADDQNITAALAAVQKLQFLVKLQADVAKKHDELVQPDYGSDQDDDLYV